MNTSDVLVPRTTLTALPYSSLLHSTSAAHATLANLQTHRFLFPPFIAPSSPFVFPNTFPLRTPSSLGQNARHTSAAFHSHRLFSDRDCSLGLRACDPRILPHPFRYQALVVLRILTPFLTSSGIRASHEWRVGCCLESRLEGCVEECRLRSRRVGIAAGRLHPR